MDTMHNYWGTGMGFGMWVFWILFIAAIVVLIRYLFGTKHEASPPGSDDNALEILRQRFARGEIDKDEFENMKKELDKQD